jgi:hypothetical protein
VASRFRGFGPRVFESACWIRLGSGFWVLGFGIQPLLAEICTKLLGSKASNMLSLEISRAKAVVGFPCSVREKDREPGGLSLRAPTPIARAANRCGIFSSLAGRDRLRSGKAVQIPILESIFFCGSRIADCLESIVFGIPQSAIRNSLPEIACLWLRSKWGASSVGKASRFTVSSRSKAGTLCLHRLAVGPFSPQPCGLRPVRCFSTLLAPYVSI